MDQIAPPHQAGPRCAGRQSQAGESVGFGKKETGEDRYISDPGQRGPSQGSPPSPGGAGRRRKFQQPNGDRGQNERFYGNGPGIQPLIAMCNERFHTATFPVES